MKKEGLLERSACDVLAAFEAKSLTPSEYLAGVH